MTTDTATSLRSAIDLYVSTWGREPAVVASAPGRVNLIGEHTDYNDGFVMPMAIDRRTTVALGPGNVSQAIELTSAEKRGAVRVSGPPWNPTQTAWANYVVGVFAGLQSLFPTGSSGTERLSFAIASDVPLGSGLSSSAALEAAAGTAILSYCGQSLPPADLAKVCQRAEHEFAGVKCGIMDQMASVLGGIVVLDCRSLETESVTLPEGVRVVILDSGIPRGLSSSAYNERRSQCEQGVERMKRKFPDITALRDVTPQMLEEAAGLLDTTVYRRCRHVVTENARVTEALRALRRGDVDATGGLMLRSHESMRDDYEISLPEMDTLVELAASHEGCFGARLTGAGFGGAAVALVEKGSAEGFADQVVREYRQATNRSGRALQTNVEPGARLDRHMN